MMIVHFVKVGLVVGGGENLRVQNVDTGQPFGVHGDELVAAMLSADLYTQEIKVTKTDLAKILVASHNRPLTVEFVTSKGEDRTLRGRFVRHEDMLGRSYCEDLDRAAGDRLRLVDHRTLRSLIVEGVKYTAK